MQVDMSILLMSLVAGVSFDGVIARFVGVTGYGAIVGAGLGNVMADVIAGLPEGLYSALGVGLGAVVPLVPIVIPMLWKRPLTRSISLMFGASSLACCIVAFVWGYEHNQGEKSFQRHPLFSFSLSGADSKKDLGSIPSRTRVLLTNIEECVLHLRGRRV